MRPGNAAAAAAAVLWPTVTSPSHWLAHGGCRGCRPRRRRQTQTCGRWAQARVQAPPRPQARPGRLRRRLRMRMQVGCRLRSSGPGCRQRCRLKGGRAEGSEAGAGQGRLRSSGPQPCWRTEGGAWERTRGRGGVPVRALALGRAMSGRRLPYACFHRKWTQKGAADLGLGPPTHTCPPPGEPSRGAPAGCCCGCWPWGDACCGWPCGDGCAAAADAACCSGDGRNEPSPGGGTRPQQACCC